MGRLNLLSIGISDLCSANNRVERSSYFVGVLLLFIAVISTWTFLRKLGDDEAY